MAKSGAMETVDPASVAKATEMKRELQRLVKSIVEDEECSMETFDKASKTIASLKDLKLKRSLSQKLDSVNVPEHFLCPISSELMKDPVILATGQVRIWEFESWGCFIFFCFWFSRLGFRVCFLVLNLCFPPLLVLGGVDFGFCDESFDGVSGFWWIWVFVVWIGFLVGENYDFDDESMLLW